MHVTIIKDSNFDRIAIHRKDGSQSSTQFPKKGPVPHDAVHYFVEHHLRLSSAFWGMIAAGKHPDDVQAIAKAGGHASASRARMPDANIVQLLQAERLVECFEAALWQGQLNKDDFRAIAATACENAYVPMPEMSDKDISTIMKDVWGLHSIWCPAPAGYVYEFTWHAV